MPRESLLKIRRGTATQWTTTNPTLEPGEPGFETDTNKLKVGDGSTEWVDLDYTTGDDPGGAGTPEEIRDALESLTGTDRLDASAIQNLPPTGVARLQVQG